jgi:hypothetical protein
MKSFKQFLKEEIKKEERRAQNIVGAEQEQKEDKAVEQDDEGMTPGTVTPTGGEQPAEQPAVAAAPIEDKKDEPDPVVEIIMQQLKDRKDKMMQQNQQEFAIRQQDYDNFMKEIEDIIAKNKNQ